MMGRRGQARATGVITLNTGAGAVAENHAYQLRTPVLALAFGLVQVQVTTAASDRVTAAEVEFARQLAKEAQHFARCVERIHRRGMTAA
ncbi:hypothetical protein FHU36_002698 [Nonomuraea muscovyensis]|uniref:Uncharacterized protein n=1 Tax=Nonomuraea muscovyensis TaxID=1124761 RepID=A0A7X0EY82_9ACTN|nr:hypothetical protein [Nonomuraea muscovyensis]MBB6346189.1 hypothetical protein [Nonomuraea muscovyensis]